MTKIVLRKNFNSFVPDPTDPAAADFMKSLRHGEFITVEAKRPRNIQHHRLFFALVKIVFENQERYETEEHLLAALKVGLGHCDTVILKSGATAFLPRSISFAKMDQPAFNAFFDKAVDLVVKHFLPGVDSDALRQEVLDMVA